MLHMSWASLATSLLLLASIPRIQCFPGQHAPPNGAKIPKLGAVASESDVCSKIGIDLLRAGGNAADSIVGTVFCIGVIGMYHSGIGGGGFMLVRSKNGTYEFIDFRETAPAAAFEDMYKEDPDASLLGGLASGVPGEIRGLEYLHTKYGVLPWADVIHPAVKAARYGFTVTEDLLKYINSTSPNKFLTDDPSWAIDFAPRGRLVKLGETITRKRYADTLEAIAQQGPDAFYDGPIAEATIAALKAANGTMTLEDLSNYTIAIREPVQIDYRGYKVTSTNAPSGGIVALSALNAVGGYDNFFDTTTTNLSTHRLDEAIRFAYGQRTTLGDPFFVDGLSKYTQDMISSRTVAADRSGLSISLTTTINTFFGSQVIVPETGIILNNEMNDFSNPGVDDAFGYAPSPANYVRSGKRPLSSISPIIVEKDGKLYLSIGAAGGSRIITSTIQNIIHVLDQDLSVPQALAQPRLHDQLVPNLVSFEYAYDNSTVDYLRSLGHNVTWVAPGQSTAQGIRLLPNGTFEAAGEPRQKNSGGFAI